MLDMCELAGGIETLPPAHACPNQALAPRPLQMMVENYFINQTILSATYTGERGCLRRPALWSSGQRRPDSCMSFQKHHVFGWPS
jgi:hypothetical protein